MKAIFPRITNNENRTTQESRTMDLTQQITELAQQAKAAARAMATVGTERKNRALFAMSRMLLERKSILKQENEKDLAEAQKQQMSSAFLDRLTLRDSVIESMASGLEDVARLPRSGG